MTDMVNHPSHYTKHPVFTGECWTYSQLLENGAEFSVFRYVWRWRSKFKPLEDLYKAMWYLDRLLERYPHGRGLVNAKRRAAADQLEKERMAWHAKSTQPDKAVNELSAETLELVMRGQYHRAACALKTLLTKAKSDVYDLEERGETGTNLHLGIEALTKRSDLPAKRRPAPTYVTTSFSFAGHESTMLFHVDLGSGDNRYFTVIVYATSKAGDLTSYVALHRLLDGCTDLVTALVTDGSTAFNYEHVRGQTVWSMVVADNAAHVRKQVDELSDAVEMVDLTRLKVEVLGLDAKDEN